MKFIKTSFLFFLIFLFIGAGPFILKGAGTKILFQFNPSIADNGWPGYSQRGVISLSLIQNPQRINGYIRLTYTVAGSSGGVIDAAWVGAGIVATPYDFDGSQVQMTFNGATSIGGLNGGVVQTDWVPFKFDWHTAVSLVVSSHFSGTSFNSYLDNVTGGNSYYLLQAAGTEGQSAPGGSWTNNAGQVEVVTEIEFR